MNDVWKYMPALDEWVCLSEMSSMTNNTHHNHAQLFTPRNSVGCFMRGDRLIMFGGFEPNEVSSDFHVSNELGRIRASGDTKDEFMTMDDDEHDADTRTTGPLAGSRISEMRNEGAPWCDSISFQRTWLNDMPRCPNAFRQGVFGGAVQYWEKDPNNTYLIAAFGCSTVWNEDNKISGVYAYHFERGEWEEMHHHNIATRLTEPTGHTSQGIPLSRYSPLHCLYDDYLYILGGRRSKDTQCVFSDMLRFSLRDKKWEVLSHVVPIPLSKDYKTVQTVLIGDLWYILSTPAQGEKAMYAYHMRRNEFRLVGVLEGFSLSGRYSLDYVDSNPNALFAIGGFKTFEFDPTNAVFKIDKPNPWKDEKELMKQTMRKNILFADVFVGSAET